MTKMMAAGTAVLFASVFGVVTAAVAADQSTVASLMTKDLVGSPGKEGTMITVEYPPGWVSAAHRHDAHTFVYVLEGSVVMAAPSRTAASPFFLLPPPSTQRVPHGMRVLTMKSIQPRETRARTCFGLALSTASSDFRASQYSSQPVFLPSSPSWSQT